MVSTELKNKKTTAASSTNRRRASTPAQNRVPSNIRGKHRKYLSCFDYSYLIVIQTVQPYVLLDPVSSLPEFKNLRRNLTAPPSPASTSATNDLPNPLNARIEELESLVRTLLANHEAIRRRQDEMQQDLASRSISRSTRGSHSVATGPPPSPVISPNSPGVSYHPPAQPGPSRQPSIFFAHSPYNPTPPRPTGYEHLLPSGQPSPGGMEFSFPPTDPQQPWPQVHRRFRDLEEGTADVDEDKVMFESVIKPQDELDDIGLLLTQPGSSAANENASTAVTANPPSPTGAGGGAESQESASLPTGPDDRAAGASAGQTLPAISISSPGDKSGNEDDMVVDGGSPRPLPVLVREQQEPPATEALSEGVESHKD